NQQHQPVGLDQPVVRFRRTRIRSMYTLAGLLVCNLLLITGCSANAGPATNPEAVRQHADRAFDGVNPKAHTQQADIPTGTTVADASTQPSPSVQNGLQVPLGEVGSPDGEMIR